MFWKNFLSAVLKVLIWVLIIAAGILDVLLFNDTLSAGKIIFLWVIEIFIIMLSCSSLGLKLEEVEHLENIEVYLKNMTQTSGNAYNSKSEYTSSSGTSVFKDNDAKPSAPPRRQTEINYQAPKTSTWTCPDCGNSNKSYSEFCEKCGYKKNKKQKTF